MIEHIGELRRRDRDRTVGRRRPDKAAALQPLRIERHADPVVPDDLDQVTSGTAKTYKSPACGSRPSACCTCSANPFMPLRMSVRPTASQTLTPEGTGI